MVKIMASTTHSNHTSPVTDALAAQTAAIDAALNDNARRAANMFAGIGAWYARRRAASAAFRELSELTDRELADLGIARADIPSVVKGKFVRRD